MLNTGSEQDHKKDTCLQYNHWKVVAVPMSWCCFSSFLYLSVSDDEVTPSINGGLQINFYHVCELKNKIWK